MVQKKIVVLECDLCGAEGEGVETHRIHIDAIARLAEVCARCWEGIVASFAVFATAGRAPEIKTQKAGKALEWPGTPWRFSSHALLRMGQRKVTPQDVLRALDNPEIKRPGKASDQEIWQRGQTKVVVVPDRQVIITVANGSEDDEELLP